MSADDLTTDSWTIAEAKAKLSEVIDKACHQGPQAITLNGKRAVVVIDVTHWERMQKRERQGSFADFLLGSPLRGSGFEGTALPGGIREIDL